MTQAERDRLVTLKKTQKGLITRQQAALELGVSVRQAKRLVKALKKRGDKVVIHGLRGRESANKVPDCIRKEAVGILKNPIFEGIGPTYACEHLLEKHGIEVSKETLRKWMIDEGIWKKGRRKKLEVHPWRARRRRCGELVQWDTSDHDWLEGRGDELYLIAMIDDATGRLYARFVRSDSTEENMRVLWGYIDLYGLPLAFYTDKASKFQTVEKRRRDEPGVEKDAAEMPPTQIGRALQELGAVWIGAQSPQAKGRVERAFGTAQDRLVKGMRLAGVCTLEQANEYLEKEFLPWWNRTLTVKPAEENDAHRPLRKGQELAAILSHVEQRQVSGGYVVRYGGKHYQVDRRDIRPGLRGASVRVEYRLNGEVAMRHNGRYLRISICEQPERTSKVAAPPRSERQRRGSNAGGKSRWMKGFWEQPAVPLGKAIAISNARS